MAVFSVKNVSISGISACVPEAIKENADLTLFGPEGAGPFIASTGIERRRVTRDGICTSDLCCKATEALLDKLNWEKDSIDALVFVTQTPDYVVPATSPLLQHKLGLSRDCYTLDISLGCSGWVYGLSVVSSLLSGGGMKRALLLAGDTPSLMCSDEDKSTLPLFGDAGTATAVEFTGDPNHILHFTMNTDGRGAKAIRIEDGGYRNPVTSDSFASITRGEGVVSNNLQVILDGMDVFSFGISRAPESVNTLLNAFDLDRESIDYYIFHQANLFMNEKIRKKLKLSEEKVPYSLKDFGNTSSATIPLTMLVNLKDRLEMEKLKHIGCGFGVGLSWGSVYFETNRITCPELIEY